MSNALDQFHTHSKHRVSIIGAGHTGCALAADLKHRGFSVCLYAHPNHADRLSGIAQRNTMLYSGIIEGECCPDLLTTDEEIALAFADDIILALPSYAQEDMFALLAPHIEDHHRLINLNGNFSSYILARELGDKNPVIVETNSAPHASRASGSGDVEIVGVKKFIPIASLGKLPSDAAKKSISAIIPSTLEWHPDIVAVSLQAYNGVLHPAPMILNAGRVEDHTSPFRFYAQGISESVGKVVEQIDQERLKIAALYGHDHLRTTLDALKGIYNEAGFHTISEFSQKANVYQKIDAPKDIMCRYLSEDVPYVLVPWYMLGLRVGFEAKAIRSIIDLASVIHGEDYLRTGRTLDKMLLPSLDNQPVQKTERSFAAVA